MNIRDLLNRRVAGPFQLGDVLTVMVVAIAGIGGSIGAAGNQPAARPMDAVAVALLATATLALLARRHHPVAVLGVTLALTLVYMVGGYAWGPIFVTLWVPAYTLAADHPGGLGRALTAAAVSAGVIAVTDAAVSRPPPSVGQLLVLWPVVMLLPVWAGWVVRVRRDQLAERTRRRVDAERLRIARELHDVVGHSIALINFQAGVAVHVIDRQPQQAREAMVTVKQVSKDALAELRATLGVLRQFGDAEDAPRTPVPGLARLDTLVEQARAGGLAVRVAVTGEVVELPLAVDVAAYRIVQESLTNVARHAGATAATVQLSYADGEMIVEVTDDGSGAGPAHHGQAPGGAGYGIAGMRERALALGGTLEAGPCARGWRVRARLPVAGGLA